MPERDTLIEALDLHRGFLLYTARGLAEDQARSRSTVSGLTIAGILQHVADTEDQWMDFAVRGTAAFAPSGGDGAGVDWEGDGFTVSADQTLDGLRNRLARTAARTAEVLREADLDADHELPEAPWFKPGTRWSVRRVALHVLAEISQHAGHADILRESIDGQRTMG